MRNSNLVIVLVSLCLMGAAGCGDNGGSSGPGSSPSGSNGPYWGKGNPPPPTIYALPEKLYDENSCPNTPVTPQCPNYNNSSDQKLCQKILAAATPLTASREFYRWGEADFEYNRIALNKPFDFVGRPDQGTGLASNGTGATAYGLGLYMAHSPTDSIDYAKGLKMQSKGLVVLVAPPGTLLLTQSALAAAGLDATAVENLYPAPPIIYQTVVSTWYVLKTNQGVCAEYFTGKYNTTHDLLQFRDDAKNNDQITGDYFDSLIAKALSRRYFNPAQQQPVPMPNSNWYDLETSKHLLTASDLPKDETKTVFFWNYEGGCNEYYDNGRVLARAGVEYTSECESVFPLTSKSRDPHGLCYANVVGEPKIKVLFDDHADGCP